MFNRINLYAPQISFPIALTPISETKKIEYVPKPSIRYNNNLYFTATIGQWACGIFRMCVKGFYGFNGRPAKFCVVIPFYLFKLMHCELCDPRVVCVRTYVYYVGICKRRSLLPDNLTAGDNLHLYVQGTGLTRC